MMATTHNHYLIVSITTSIFLIAVYFPESAAQYGSFMFPSYNMPPGFLDSRMPHRMEPHFSHNFWPPSRPLLRRPPYSSYLRPPIYAQPRPPSPANQCRITGACREVYHGTPLPTTWRIQTTTPIPATRYTSRTTTEPLIDRSDALPTTIARLDATTLLTFGSPAKSSPISTAASSPVSLSRPTSLATTTALTAPPPTRAIAETTSLTTKLEDRATNQTSPTSSIQTSSPFTTSTTLAIIIVNNNTTTNNETDAVPRIIS